jgi:DNA (cytosine-5)-methyltransferase 1
VKPRLLNVFSGSVCSAGYKRAGFHVTDVDIHPMPRHTGDVFIQADAIDYLAMHGHEYDAIHASPPCQTHSVITPDSAKSKHLDLIPLTRFMLENIGVPYVIENVEGARKALRNPFMLCGTYFGLKVYRHRLFESNVMILVPSHSPHKDKTPSAGHKKDGSYLSPKGFISLAGHFVQVKQWDGNGKRPKHFNVMANEDGFITVTGHFGQTDYGRFAMGVDWYVTNKELAQAIPPAYTEYIGRQLMQHVLYRRGQPAETWRLLNEIEKAA